MRSKHGRTDWCSALLWVLLVAAAVGCGKSEHDRPAADPGGSGGSAAAAGEAASAGAESVSPGGSSGDAGELVGIPSETEACQALGISYQKGCAACPEALDCPCFGPIEFNGQLTSLVEPLPRCVEDHCVLGGDCSQICAGSEPAPPFGLPSDTFVETVHTLQGCFDQSICAGDDWCPVHHKCLVEEAETLGRCASGEVDDICLDDDDCWGGICASDLFRLCRSGEKSATCNENDDCLSGQCVLYDGFAGRCMSGEPGDLCQSGGCKPDLSCVPDAAGASKPGVCSAGNQGDACAEPSQCQSGFCVDRTCSAGGPRASCLSDQDCQSSHCVKPADSPPGAHWYCVSGEVGSECFGPNHCNQGLCALHAPGRMGLCSLGETGDHCSNDADCLSSKCNVPKPAEIICTGLLAGSACGDGGICDADQVVCQYGKCAAP